MESSAVAGVSPASVELLMAFRSALRCALSCFFWFRAISRSRFLKVCRFLLAIETPSSPDIPSVAKTESDECLSRTAEGRRSGPALYHFRRSPPPP